MTSRKSYLKNYAEDGTSKLSICQKYRIIWAKRFGLGGLTDADMKLIAQTLNRNVIRTRYTFQDRYISTGPTDILVEYTLTNNTKQYVPILLNIPRATTWTLATGSFTVPQGVKSMNVYHLIYTSTDVGKRALHPTITMQVVITL